jgi:hypothetical protein
VDNSAFINDMILYVTTLLVGVAMFAFMLLAFLATVLLVLSGRGLQLALWRLASAARRQVRQLAAGRRAPVRRWTNLGSYSGGGSGRRALRFQATDRRWLQPQLRQNGQLGPNRSLGLGCRVGGQGNRCEPPGVGECHTCQRSGDGAQ